MKTSVCSIIAKSFVTLIAWKPQNYLFQNNLLVATPL